MENAITMNRSTLELAAETKTWKAIPLSENLEYIPWVILWVRRSVNLVAPSISQNAFQQPSRAEVCAQLGATLYMEAEKSWRLKALELPLF